MVAHLHRLGVPSAAVALPWVTRGFVGYMPVGAGIKQHGTTAFICSRLAQGLNAWAVALTREEWTRPWHWN